MKKIITPLLFLCAIFSSLTIPTPIAATTNSPAIIEITSESQFNQLLANGRPCILLCSATWCPPCRATAPHFKTIAEKYAGQLTFAHIDIDEDSTQGILSRYQVRSIPTLIVFGADGKQVSKQTGAKTASDLEKIVLSVLK